MAYDLQFASGPNYTTGKYGTGLVNSRAVINNSALGSLSAVTIESWFAKTNVGYGILIGTRYGPEIGTSAEGFARFRVKHEREVVTAIQVCDGQLHHMALCVSLTGGTTFFVDGVKVYTDTVANGFAEEQFGIGQRIGVGYSWDGVIDDIAITGAIKYTADFVPGPISTMQPNLVALYQFENNINNTAGVVIQANAIELTGPATGSQGVASSVFTATANGALSAPCVVTPTPVAGITFNPSSLTLTDAARSGTFTATSSTTGAKSIAVTNDGTLANPAAITWTVAAVDNRAPLFVNARVGAASPTTILVTMDEALAASLPPNGAFTASLGRTVTGVAVNGAVVSVTVNTAYARGDIITIGYTKPGTNPRLQDAAGNAVESFTAQPVLNAIKVAVPTQSSPGRRVVRVGIGMDFAGPNELATYLTTQNLKDSQEILIAEVYDNWTTGGGIFGVPSAQQTGEYYCIVRPVPGYGEADLTPDGPFNYGADGIEIAVTGELKLRPGTLFEEFRFDVQGSGRIALGGVNTQGQPHVCGIVRSRIRLSGSQFNAVSIGEYETIGSFTDNLVLRTAGTGRVEGFAVKQIISRNTFVAQNGATGEFVLAGGQAIVENNAFINAGPVILNSSSSNVAGNYTNMALSTPRTGLTAITETPFVTSATNFIPAANSPLLGNATDSAISIIDARNANRGINPDVGAWQKVAANALPSGAVTGSPKPSGQQLRVPFTTTQNPAGATATLTPSAINANGAISNTGVVTLDNVADTGEAVFSDIAAGNYTLSITISNDGGSAQVSGLPSISIIAVDGQPELPMVGAATLSPPGIPSSVVAVAGNGMVQLSWNPPFVTGGTPITGYEIVSSSGTQFTSAQNSAQVAAPNNIPVTYQVRAINSEGAGSWSEPSNQVTPVVPPVVPGAPVIGVATSGNKRITITFTPPASSGDSPITGYIVTPSVGPAVNVTGSPATFPATNNLPVTCRVQAVSAAGVGPMSQASNSVTPQATATVFLKNPDGSPLGSQANIKWAWFDQPTPDTFANPVDQGNAETSEAVTGKVVIVLPNTNLNSGDIGGLLFTNSDGSVTMNHKAFFGPVEVD